MFAANTRGTQIFSITFQSKIPQETNDLVGNTLATSFLI